jgi:transcriptional regulator GlxA family with amidase domain
VTPTGLSSGGFSGGLEELVLKIPRDVFADVTGIDSVPRPVIVDFSAGANSFAHTLARLVGGAARDTDPAPIREETLLELVAGLAGRNRDDLRAAHRAATYTYVEQHLSDPGLSATQVAAAVGISTRQLSRVLAEVGTTLPQHVLGRRLAAARTLLETPAATSMTIAEVAHRSGFTSAAHFSSAFSARFGERASDVRRRAAAARAIPLR